MAKISQKLFPKDLFICTDHFEPECFKRDLKVRFDFSEKKKKITLAILMRKVTKMDPK